MAELRDVIDYAKAPLSQWEPAIGQAISEGKAAEDKILYRAITTELRRENAQSITGIIADEGRLELAVEKNVPSAKKITHLTLSGAFEAVARQNTAGSRVAVVTNTDAIKNNSQDAVLMSLILGCVATARDHGNVHALAHLAAGLLKDDGKLILARPNPEGGAFSTYTCLTPANKLESGKDYDFTVKGLENLGPMKNLYTPDNFIATVFEKVGLKMGATKKVAEDANPASKPFLLNVCRKAR